MQIGIDLGRNAEWATVALIAIAASAGFLLLVALLWWLWNITLPEVFRLPPITYWQARRLVLISTILFGGIIG
jgi:hypothetical protein